MDFSGLASGPGPPAASAIFNSRGVTSIESANDLRPFLSVGRVEVFASPLVQCGGESLNSLPAHWRVSELSSTNDYANRAVLLYYFRKTTHFRLTLISCQRVEKHSCPLSIHLFLVKQQIAVC